MTFHLSFTLFLFLVSVSLSLFFAFSFASRHQKDAFRVQSQI